MRLFLPILSLALTSIFAKSPIKLTDANFEKLTQATTGSTTGRWFVGFFRHNCGHCKKMKPTWEELAEAVEGEYNIASVEADKESAITSKRFGVQGFPSLFVLEKGVAYQYGGERTVEGFKSFLEGGYLNSEKVKRKFDIPSEPSAAQMYIERGKSLKKDIRNKPMATAVSFGAGLSIGVISTLLFCCCLPTSSKRKSEVEGKKRD